MWLHRIQQKGPPGGGAWKFLSFLSLSLNLPPFLLSGNAWRLWVEEAVQPWSWHTVSEMLLQWLVASGDPCTRVQKAAASVDAGGNPVRITRGSSHRRALSRTPSSQHGRSRGGRFSQQLARGRAGCLFTLFNPSSEARSGAAANLIRSLCVEAPFRDSASPPWWSSFLTNCLRSGEGQASDSTHRLSKPLFSECGLPGCRTVIWHLQAGGDSLCWPAPGVRVMEEIFLLLRSLRSLENFLAPRRDSYHWLRSRCSPGLVHHFYHVWPQGEIFCPFSNVCLSS